ncbi:AraC family transcriptional regulator [Clostridium swellfunianum]|uniref:AraC family transcriptional regulator n=1 Tax=Clostridium swellfunianum TaxID=1367462 RepID=UPI00202E51CE|nr:AraC family transcriptional regulator [Clostridium swellfunianum]MCM0647609.1 AraC family transcriptional regulator [Clostridium swellfunianum]
MNKDILQKLKHLTKEEIGILHGKNQIDKELYMSSKSTIVDSRKLLDSGKLIEVRTHTRFVHFPMHTHNYVEVVYMCEGKTEHIINGDKVTLNKGELLFLNQNATQEILPAEGNDVAVNFIILPEFFDQSLKMIGEEENMVRHFIIGCLRSTDYNIGYLHFKVADVLPIQNLVENLIWTLTNNQLNKRSINQLTMGLMFLQLMNHTDKVTVGRNLFEQGLILTVYRFIEEHYKDGELSALAEALHFDLYWISRQIKKLTGKTYTELVQTKRLIQAAFLLNSTNMPVSDVGYAVGYDNLSYFHRIFKARYGVSPKQYRKAEN